MQVQGDGRFLMREVPLYGGKHVGTWSSAQKKARVESEKENRLRALRVTRPNLVGYIGGCDQEQGKDRISTRVKRAPQRSETCSIN